MNNFFSSDISVLPSYFFSKQELQKNYLSYKCKYQRCKVLYAMKANGEPEVLQSLSGVADGVEVANYCEFSIAIKNGFSCEKIICSAPVKALDDLIQMYQGGCKYFVFDSESEYKKIQQFAPKCVKIMRIDVTDLDATSIEFGMPFILSSCYDIQGVAIHLPNRSIQLIMNVFKRIAAILDTYSIKNNKGKDFYINLGGGYSLNDKPDEIEYINEQINIITSRYATVNIRWIMEPGNGIVQSAGYFACRVECIKDKGNVKYVYINGGIPEGIQVKHGKITNISSVEYSDKRNIYAFFDTTCLHQRLFVYPSKSVYHEGDILVISDCGGYTTCYINRFHAKKPPNIILMDEIVL